MARQHTCSEAFTLLGVYCISQCAIGLHYETARTVSKARETATNLLEFLTLQFVPLFKSIQDFCMLCDTVFEIERKQLVVLYPLPVCFFTITLAGVKFGTAE